MGELRYTMLAISRDPVPLREGICRFWHLLDSNDDPAALAALKQLIAEADARLASLGVAP